MTFGIPNTSFCQTSSPSLDNATWFNHGAFIRRTDDILSGDVDCSDEVIPAPVSLMPGVRTPKNKATNLRVRAQALAEAAQGSHSKMKRLRRRETAIMSRIWAKHSRDNYSG